MTSENFVYWLQGFLELSSPEYLNKIQVGIIKDHIALVLKKETPVVDQNHMPFYNLESFTSC